MSYSHVLAFRLASFWAMQSLVVSEAAPLNCSVSHAHVKAGSPGMLPKGIFNFDIYSPEDGDNCITGKFPIIFFVTGFGASVPATLYSDLLTQIVQQGFIVVGLSRLGVPNYPMEGGRLLDVLEWAQAGHLEEMMAMHNFTAIPDILERAAVMGQSAGNHVVGEALVSNCSVVKAFVMIDPVDGFDPFGVDHKQDLITPGIMLNFTTPGLLIDNGLDPKKLNRLFPACAPANMSNDKFYNAWPGPIWNINATAYGHIDCLNDGAASSVAKYFVCPSNSKTNKASYRSMIADAAATFLSALFQSKPDQLKLLEDPSHFSIDVVLKYDLKGLSRSSVKPSCINTPAPGTAIHI